MDEMQNTRGAHQSSSGSTVCRHRLAVLAGIGVVILMSLALAEPALAQDNGPPSGVAGQQSSGQPVAPSAQIPAPGTTPGAASQAVQTPAPDVAPTPPTASPDPETGPSVGSGAGGRNTGAPVSFGQEVWDHAKNADYVVQAVMFGRSLPCW